MNMLLKLFLRREVLFKIVIREKNCYVILVLLDKRLQEFNRASLALDL